MSCDSAAHTIEELIEENRLSIESVDRYIQLQTKVLNAFPVEASQLPLGTSFKPSRQVYLGDYQLLLQELHKARKAMTELDPKQLLVIEQGDPIHAVDLAARVGSKDDFYPVNEERTKFIWDCKSVAMAVTSKLSTL